MKQLQAQNEFLQPEIRPFEQSFRKDVEKFVLQIQQREFCIPITYEEQKDLHDPYDFFVRQYNGNFWLALSGSQVIGTIGLVNIGGGNGIIKKMFVHKDWRGREYGIGAKLIATLESWAKSERGIKRIYLGTADILKAANRFYQKNGYIQVEKADLPAGFMLVDVDNVFYGKEL